MKPWAKAQIDAALKTAKPVDARARHFTKRTRGSMLRCVCGHEETSSAKMDAHCDAAGHHRYELVLP